MSDTCDSQAQHADGQPTLREVAAPSYPHHGQGKLVREGKYSVWEERELLVCH